MAIAHEAVNPGYFGPTGGLPTPRVTEKDCYISSAYFDQSNRIAAISPSKPRTRRLNNGRHRLPEILIGSGVAHDLDIPECAKSNCGM
jgi:hypothetical protein